jgi:DNA-binding SARP family transcriptional activator
MSVALRIQLLGGFSVQMGDRPIADGDWRLLKARGLVKLLALAPRHRLGREAVLERLWPEVEPEAGLNNLYYALHVARAALGRTTGSSVLQLAGGALTLAPCGSGNVDVEAFQAAACAARASKEPRAYNVALALYAGELLPEDAYEDWTARPREVLRESHLQLLWELAGLHHTRGEDDQAIDAYRRLVTLDPTHEAACVSLMRLARRGRPAAPGVAALRALADGVAPGARCRAASGDPTPAGRDPG